MNDLWRTAFPSWLFVIRAGAVYLFVLLLLRMAGKRQIGQMSTGEFVAILLISNAVQNSMNGGDNSITGGMVLALVIIGLSILVDYLTYRSRKLEAIIQGVPTLLIHKGKPIQENLRRELVSPHELRTILRRQGIHDYCDVETAILESNGSVSVTRKSDPKPEEEDCSDL
jgi:uncharacterized membrane protein YcaP (DUF421 family)